jgi:hypothetical protein
MDSPVAGSLVLAALALILFLLRDWPRILCAVALAGCALPFFLPPSAPLLRAFAAVLTCLLLVKALQFAAGHATPRGRFDFLLFILTFATVRWETPRRPDPRRAVRRLATGLFLLGLAWLVRDIVLRLDVHNPVQLFTSQLGLYLLVAGGCNLAAVKLCLRGLDHDDVFHNPFASRTPAEFWGRRWNSYVGHLLHRYVFLPAGGRRHPGRGVLAAFAASALLHEVVFDIGARVFNGGMLAYFLLQAALVTATSRSRFYRTLARETPVVAWLLTIVLMLLTGVLFVRGMDGVDPSYGWRRVFGPV